MGRAIAIISGAARAPLMPLTRPLALIGRYLRQFASAMTDDYRPERHYMRGPGPAWRRKHGSRAPSS